MISSPWENVAVFVCPEGDLPCRHNRNFPRTYCCSNLLSDSCRHNTRQGLRHSLSLSCLLAPGRLSAILFSNWFRKALDVP